MSLHTFLPLFTAGLLLAILATWILLWSYQRGAASTEVERNALRLELVAAFDRNDKLGSKHKAARIEADDLAAERDRLARDLASRVEALAEGEDTRKLLVEALGKLRDDLAAKERQRREAADQAESYRAGLTELGDQMTRLRSSLAALLEREKAMAAAHAIDLDRARSDQFELGYDDGYKAAVADAREALDTLDGVDDALDDAARAIAALDADAS